MRSPGRRLLPLLAFVVALAVAVPALSADPTPGPGAAPSPSPGKGTAPGQQRQDAKGPEVAITLHGTVVRTTDGQGRPAFTLAQGGTTWELSAGPKWWWGAAGGPLAAYVGKTVDVVGTHRVGSTDVDVTSVDGTALRTAGKPPWAGGPKVVGERHPGWKAWMADGKPGRGLGRDGAPGQQKPEASEAPGG